jgi:hypothetical protein
MDESYSFKFNIYSSLTAKLNALGKKRTDLLDEINKIPEHFYFIHNHIPTISRLFDNSHNCDKKLVKTNNFTNNKYSTYSKYIVTVQEKQQPDSEASYQLSILEEDIIRSLLLIAGVVFDAPQKF